MKQRGWSESRIEQLFAMFWMLLAILSWEPCQAFSVVCILFAVIDTVTAIVFVIKGKATSTDEINKEKQ